jgi:hypothetical protein
MPGKPRARPKSTHSAGGRATDDAIRSPITSHKLLGVKEWFVLPVCGYIYDFITKPSLRPLEECLVAERRVRSQCGPLTGKHYGSAKTRIGLSKCSDCRKKFVVQVGTVFESAISPPNGRKAPSISYEPNKALVHIGSSQIMTLQDGLSAAMLLKLSIHDGTLRGEHKPDRCTPPATRRWRSVGLIN